MIEKSSEFVPAQEQAMLLSSSGKELTMVRNLNSESGALNPETTNQSVSKEQLQEVHSAEQSIDMATVEKAEVDVPL